MHERRSDERAPRACTATSEAFAGIRAVDGVSFAIKPGSMTGLIGPNGSGKSTTIDCISGFQRPDGGRVLLAGRDITGARPRDLSPRAELMQTFRGRPASTKRLSVLGQPLSIAAQRFDAARLAR